MDQLALVNAQEVLLPRPGCTELPGGAFWRCPLSRRPTPTPTATGPAAIARQAALRLLARHGRIGVLPGRTLVGLPTYFWLDGVARREAVRSEAGWRLRIVAQPVGYTWRFGDGEQVTGGPGRAQPPQSSQIQHTYAELGRYEVTVQVAWHVTFRVDGRVLDAPGQFTTTATTALTVDELRARLTG